MAGRKAGIARHRPDRPPTRDHSSPSRTPERGFPLCHPTCLRSRRERESAPFSKRSSPTARRAVTSSPIQRRETPTHVPATYTHTPPAPAKPRRVRRDWCVTAPSGRDPCSSARLVDRIALAVALARSRLDVAELLIDPGAAARRLDAGGGTWNGDVRTARCAACQSPQRRPARDCPTQAHINRSLPRCTRECQHVLVEPGCAMVRWGVRPNCAVVIHCGRRPGSHSADGGGADCRHAVGLPRSRHVGAVGKQGSGAF